MERLILSGVVLKSCARTGRAGTKMLVLSGEKMAATAAKRATSHFVEGPKVEYGGTMIHDVPGN